MDEFRPTTRKRGTHKTHASFMINLGNSDDMLKLKKRVFTAAEKAEISAAELLRQMIEHCLKEMEKNAS